MVEECFDLLGPDVRGVSMSVYTYINVSVSNVMPIWARYGWWGSKVNQGIFCNCITNIRLLPGGGGSSGSQHIAILLVQIKV